MSARPASGEPVVSVAHPPPDAPDPGAPLGARRAVLALARLIGRQIAREQHATQRKHEKNAPGSEPDAP
jgi:hypothetical protein